MATVRSWVGVEEDIKVRLIKPLRLLCWLRKCGKEIFGGVQNGKRKVDGGR